MNDIKVAPHNPCRYSSLVRVLGIHASFGHSVFVVRASRNSFVRSAAMSQQAYQLKPVALPVHGSNVMALIGLHMG